MLSYPNALLSEKTVYIYDPVELVDRMRGDDTAAKRIAEAGFAYFQANVTRSDTLCYIWRLIRSIDPLSLCTYLHRGDLSENIKIYKERKI